MALFGNGITIPDGAQPNYGSGNGEDVWRFVQPSLANSAQSTIEGMFAGTANDAARARTNEALARSAQQFRASGASQMAPVIGQGAAIQAQQGIEQNIMQTVADTQLGFAEQDQAAKERAIGMTMNLEAQGAKNSQDLFNRRMSGVNVLLQSGGAANRAEASEELAEMFPGVTFDFSNANLQEGMSTLTQMIASGMTTEQAMAMATQQGIGASLNMDDVALRGLYQGMLRQANPMLATIDQLGLFGAEMGMNEASISTMIDTYMETTTGMEMEQSADGTWRVIPADGYTRVGSLYNVVPGDMVKFDNPLTAPNGTQVPAGKYTISVTTDEDADQDWWSGSTETIYETFTWAVGEDGTKYLVNSTSSKEITEGTGGANFVDPLSLFQ